MENVCTRERREEAVVSDKNPFLRQGETAAVTDIKYIFQSIEGEQGSTPHFFPTPCLSRHLGGNVGD